MPRHSPRRGSTPARCSAVADAHPSRPPPLTRSSDTTRSDRPPHGRSPRGASLAATAFQSRTRKLTMPHGNAQGAAQAANLAEQGQTQQAKQFGVGATMDAQRANEQLKQQDILGYIQAAGGLAALEDQTTLDPFQAVLGRGGGNALQQGQSVFGQAGYGLQSAPQYLNPEAGLGFIQNQATNAANMYSAQVAADATKQAGIMSGLGSLGGGLLGNSGLFT